MDKASSDVVMNYIEDQLPDLKNVQMGKDPITDDDFFFGTDSEGRKVKFIAKIKITQISKKVSE